MFLVLGGIFVVDAILYGNVEFARFFHGFDGTTIALGAHM